MEDTFQAERLTLARNRRGMTIAALAKAVSLTPQTISAYERSKSAPADDVVERLARALGFPVGFFYADLKDVVPLDAASFRSLSRMGQIKAKAALAGGTFCVAFYQWVEDRFDLPKPNVPDLDPGIIDPESAAVYVRSAWGLGDAPVSNVLHLLEAHGVRVLALAADYREVDAFSFWHEDTGTPFICVGTHKTPERSVFDLAHELGHLCLHRDHGAPRGRDEEREADTFASSFLMPKADLAIAAPRFPSLHDLVKAKGRWRVSAAALNFRLHQLRMITDWHYRSLCIEISRVGRNRELNPIPREQSQVLTKVLAAMRAEGVGRADIAAALHLPLSELDAMLSGLVATVIDGGGEGTEDRSLARGRLRVV
ncbi:MAG: XRE family transcriptional regulator [Chloroflexota bacterium]|nr:XRE family transcriptional regulator [Chloroflexota bacterium]